MVNEGVWSERVDTQNVSLTNNTDSITFLQLLNVWIIRTAALTRHIRTDSVIENLWDPAIAAIEGDIVLTTPETTTWNTYLTQTNNQPPTKTWRLAYVPISGSTVNVDISGQVSQFRPIDSGAGVVTYHFRIEATTSTVTVS